MEGYNKRAGAKKVEMTTENERLEYKTSLSEKHEATITLAAFATAQGGEVRFGVTSDGQRVGVQIGKTTLEELANYIKQNTDPPQFPSITIEGDESSAVVIVRIEESPIKPVWAFGRPYKRVGRSNQTLSREETQRLTEATWGSTWDALLCPHFELQDLDRASIENFLRRAGLDPELSTDIMVENLGLRSGDGLCYAAALLFAKNPQRYVPDAQVQCARFLDTTSLNFLDQRTFAGGLLSQIEEAITFVKRNTRQAIRITGSPQHERVPEYPEVAVREAIINAVCHRDYASSGTVQVRIYADRMEVWNPGTLPSDLTVESLYSEHASRPRNRRIAEAFHRARLIERWGTGTLRIIGAFREQGLPPPEFLVEQGMFIVRMQPVPMSEDLPAPPSGFKERQRKAVDYVRKHGVITRKEYASLLNLRRRQAAEDLSTMVEVGILERQGAGRSTRYVLAGRTEQALQE